MMKKRSRSHKILWYAMICYDTFQKSSKHVRANGCQRLAKPMLAYPGYNMLVWYQLFAVYQEEREVRFTTPQAQCPDLACTFWVTHCVDVPQKCHRDTSGYCPNSCQLSRCMSLWFFRRFSKTFEGSRRWWNTQRKGSVLMSSAADCCHYLSSSLFGVLALLDDLWSVFCSRSAKALVMWLCRTCQMMKRRCKLWNNVPFNICSVFAIITPRRALYFRIFLIRFIYQ